MAVSKLKRLKVELDRQEYCRLLEIAEKRNISVEQAAAYAAASLSINNMDTVRRELDESRRRISSLKEQLQEEQEYREILYMLSADLSR